MKDDYGLTVRTMDVGNLPLVHWTITTVPKGSGRLSPSKHGYVGFVLSTVGYNADDLVFSGLNDAGLTCDLQTNEGTSYPKPSSTVANMDASLICKWALESFASVEELKVGLQDVNFVAPSFPFNQVGPSHWIVRDTQKAVVLEFMGGQMQAYDDHNDQGKTGFGIMTNEPPFPWHLEAVRHLQWKQGLARSAVEMPGSWYPDARFQRIWLVKSGLDKAKSYQEAFTQAVHVLNTVTVPMGKQLGTDSGSNEGSGDHTQWAVVYDHKNKTLYWRSAVNQDFQRLRLSDCELDEGKKRKYIAVFDETLPWFDDASSRLQPRADTQAGANIV
eukprot:TRINITY_DN10169_c0_g1_i1.p1 TRINITY_DN10169_c0_g1~~TRINITY_DN10169_c0_g1_i1.p1  ORF type:complete len:378 (+),score=55.08 TRINITY_DN10169_c0_g1_i1:146-1135(+)